MKKLILLTACPLIILFSCSKEENMPAPNDNNNSSFQKSNSVIPLAEGNYWIYEIVEIDDQGMETPFGFDSLYVSKDTLIKGVNYFITNSNSIPQYAVSKIIRSSNRIIAEYNESIESDSIIFNTDSVGIATTYEYFSPVAVFTQTKWINPDLVTKSVPSGTYPCFEQKVTRSFVIPPADEEFSYFSRGTGLISFQFRLDILSREFYEARLVRFNVN